MENYYEILGISLNATIKEIRTAYRKKAMEYHPDVNQQIDPIIAHEMMCKINEAYYVLSNPTLREKYDQSYKKYYDNKQKHTKEENNNAKQQSSNHVNKTEQYNKFYYEYLYSIDYDDYEKEEFINWLYRFYYSFMKYCHYYNEIDILNKTQLAKLQQLFENIIYYEKIQINKKNEKKCKSLNL